MGSEQSTRSKSDLPDRAVDIASDGEDEFEKLLKSGHNMDSLIPADLSGKDKVQHADDASDYEDEDELADEEDVEELSAESGGSGGGDAPGDEGDWTQDFAKDLGLFEDDDAAHAGDSMQQDASPQALAEAEEARRKFEEEERELALAQLKEWYPGFEPNTILRMNKLFGAEPSQTLPPQPKAVRPLVLTRMRLDVIPDESTAFLADEEPPHVRSQRIVELDAASTKKVESEVGRKRNGASIAKQKEHSAERTQHSIGELQLEVADWDSVLDAGSSSDDDNARPKTPTPVSSISDMAIVDDDIYNSEEERAILDGIPPMKRTRLDLNDPSLMFVEDKRPSLALTRRATEDPHVNISNDKAYDMLRENYQRKVRSTIGSLNIDHSMVALRLQSPFYRVRLTKPQLRSWHRQKFVVKPGTVMRFTPHKSRKKRKDKSRTAQELLMKSGDLTLGDNASVFLVEYSEENPLVLSGFGMGSKLINYYRKKSSEDTDRPKLSLGETHVLDVQDRSPFWNFGFVEPGNVVPTLYNQMIRAPVFQHKSRETDFLLIKSGTRSRPPKYFLRPIPYIYTAGQAFPAVQIPGPHSRKVTTASKNRLKMVVYRVLNNDPNHRLTIKNISTHFPDQNDMQNRQRLKEFMEYQRSGDDAGYWKVKPGEPLPTEPEIRKMVTPEDVMLLESMQVGQQQLEDSGYSKSVDDDDKDADGDGLSLDEQLAPWNISRNFINAIQGKAMLQLHGIGDPTARGEGFSLLRTSMKGGFATEVSAEDEKKLGGHSYNVALQQKAYDEEIKRIWYAQANALKVEEPRRLNEANKLFADTSSNIATPSAPSSSGKVLQITRVVRDENDVLVRQTELVTDPQVIRAYMKRRKAMEEAKLAVDKISVTNDAETDKQSRKFLEQELARLHRNQDRRQARKATKQDAKLKATTRKCATCGAVGHIKTNKSCPLYNDIYLNASKAK